MIGPQLSLRWWWLWLVADKILFEVVVLSMEAWGDWEAGAAAWQLFLKAKRED